LRFFAIAYVVFARSPLSKRSFAAAIPTSRDCARRYDRVSYSQVVKVYSKQEEGRERYSPGEFVTVDKTAIRGNPNLNRASTSHVERKNGSLRQWCKRLTRLTYAFSKSWDNLRAALALHFAYYNFCRIHSSLRVTPAMEAGIADHVWDLRELIAA
jgi:IS1 family transposase